MRRLHFATLLLTILSLAASGCRQTTPSGAGATTVGPLTPVNSGQSPTLGPFGGPTRVTPPSTGAFATPNNYLGGTGPAGQANLGISPGIAPQPGGVIGSGVQVAGWAETSPGIAPVQQPMGTPATARDPRLGGMQVIDMTRSASPPGYRPAPQNFSAPMPAVAPTNPNWQQSQPSQPFQNQQFQSQPFQNQQFQGQPLQNQSFQNQQFQGQPYQGQPVQTQGGVRAVITPGAAEIAGRGLTPVPSAPGQYPINQAPVDPNYPRTATGPTVGPSTEPVNSGNLNGSQTDLPWRRPGTQY
jgi:hypothetical protein